MTLRPRIGPVVRHYATGPLRPVARRVFDALVSAELAMDATAQGTSTDTSLDTRLTALIKTFERPATVRRLVSSIRRRYPTLPLVVVDDSRDPRPIEGVDYVTLPYNVGISAGREAGMAHVRTPFVLLMDDDFVFSRDTDLTTAVARLEARTQVDILGGQLVDLPFLRELPPPVGKIFPTSAQPIVPIGSRIDGLLVCDKVTNFFIARTDRLRLVQWDARLRLLEHADFFTRALGVLVTVFDPGLRCFHAQTPFDRAYMAHRNDYRDAQLVLAAKWRTARR